MKKAYLIVLGIIMASVLLATSFTDTGDYTTSTSTLNSTTYQSLLVPAAPTTICWVPWDGIIFVNTSSPPITVSVIWTDVVLGLTNNSSKFVVLGHTTNHVPRQFELDSTNQHIMAKVDAVTTNGLDTTVYFKDTLKF